MYDFMLSQSNNFNRAYIVKRLSKAISFIAISFMLFISLSTSAFEAAKGAHERVELTSHVATGIQDSRPNRFQVAEKKHSNKADQ